ncbi:MAG: hypothetical protein ACT4PJ_09585 [Gemmatimonadaceae bacterium]
MKTHQASDGTTWGVEVMLTSASHAMIVFRHPNRRTSRLDRYAWRTIDSPEAKNVTARLDPDRILDGLTEDDVALHFRRSMRISAADDPLGTPVTHAG